MSCAHDAAIEFQSPALLEEYRYRAWCRTCGALCCAIRGTWFSPDQSIYSLRCDTSGLLTALGIPPESGTLSERVEIALKRVKEASGG